MTKEEIIEDTWNKYPDEDTISRRTFFEAMDIYAKQEVIEFHRWATGRIDEIYMPTMNGRWEIMKPSPVKMPPEYITDEQLYEKFIQSKETNNEKR